MRCLHSSRRRPNPRPYDRIHSLLAQLQVQIFFRRVGFSHSCTITFLFISIASSKSSTRPASLSELLSFSAGQLSLLLVRVVFHSFARYIQVPWPLNYLLVTATILGGAAGAGAYEMGMIADASSSLAFTGLAVFVSAAGAINCCGFRVVPSTPCCSWILSSPFLHKKEPLIIFLLCHTRELNGDMVMYPSYMVVLTTFLGLALVRRLYVDYHIGSKAVWVLTCLYSSKLAMLFMTSKAALWASAILLLVVTPPLLLYKDRSRTASKMKPWQGYTVFALSVWFCHETIFETLQWWNGRSPSGGLLLGFFILLTGLALSLFTFLMSCNRIPFHNHAAATPIILKIPFGFNKSRAPIL